MRSRVVIGGVVTCVAVIAITARSNADPVTVTIENLSQNNGLYLTPMWLGFHDGSFDLFASGVAPNRRERVTRPLPLARPAE